MKTYEEYDATARDGAPFSNGTDWEIFQWNECFGRAVKGNRCVNDDNEDCPLIAMSVIGRTPAEYVQTGGVTTCTAKTTPAEARRAQEAADRELIASQHYPMFPEVSL